MIAGTKFDADGARRIAHPEQNLAIRLDTELSANLARRIDQLETPNPKHRSIALGNDHAIRGEYDEQKHEIDDRENDGEPLRGAHDSVPAFCLW